MAIEKEKGKYLINNLNTRKCSSNTLNRFQYGRLTECLQSVKCV